MNIYARENLCHFADNDVKKMTSNIFHKMILLHENSKKGEYKARINEIEKGTFTPLVFSCSGGTSPEADKFVKNLALKISE